MESNLLLESKPAEQFRNAMPAITLPRQQLHQTLMDAQIAGPVITRQRPKDKRLKSRMSYRSLVCESNCYVNF
jgi:hypothetical protein